MNGVLKKHLDQDTLLKELVTTIEQELKKKTSYNRIRNYYGSGLPSIYNTIFKAIDSVLVDNLTPILLPLQWAQMNQSLLYQGILINESDIEVDSTIEHFCDVSQIQLKELLSGISCDEVVEI
ncbi:hypothetical protein C2G38_2219505 [Gigaspora rosea]|uniref:Uncharacterized protein n=1 Tax=Gigaspora rosea TaxID=44941 RepID=A0A397U8V8_9GLOM|nr:hypothetical protein C2G38_2219505 [Gigaspora rosea]